MREWQRSLRKFLFLFFSLEVGNDGAEMAVVCGDDALSLGKYLKKILFPRTLRRDESALLRTYVLLYAYITACTRVP